VASAVRRARDCSVLFQLPLARSDAATLHIWTNTSAPVTYLAALFVGGPHSRGSSSLDERSILLSWLATVGGLCVKGAGSEYDALQLKICDGR
jgi:hypothetical protein